MKEILLLIFLGENASFDGSAERSAERSAQAIGRRKRERVLNANAALKRSNSGQKCILTGLNACSLMECHPIKTFYFMTRCRIRTGNTSFLRLNVV